MRNLEDYIAIRLTGLILVILLFLFIVAGCATQYEECDIHKGTDEYAVCILEAEEYAHAEYIQTKILPMIYSCYAHEGFLLYRGEKTRRMRIALETLDFSDVHRSEMVGLTCCIQCNLGDLL